MFPSLNCQITFSSHIGTKAFWLKLEGHNGGIYSFFHLCLGHNYYCILWSRRASIHTSDKLQSALWKTTLLHLRLHNKLPYKSLPAHNVTPHWISSQTERRWMIEVELYGISSARLCDQSGWRQTVSKTNSEMMLCLRLTLFCEWGETAVFCTLHTPTVYLLFMDNTQQALAPFFLVFYGHTYQIMALVLIFLNA